jgi:hypothetical protein
MPWSSNCSTGYKNRKISSDAMRYLVLTDVHANLEALESCLSDAIPRGYDQTLVLGDLIGYGADPNAVVERVRDLCPAAIVRGNHDKVVLGLDQAEGFNAVARSAAVWMLAALTSENREWVGELPQGPHGRDLSRIAVRRGRLHLR